jgi:hypothetical protein
MTVSERHYRRWAYKIIAASTETTELLLFDVA